MAERCVKKHGVEVLAPDTKRHQLETEVKAEGQLPGIKTEELVERGMKNMSKTSDLNPALFFNLTFGGH